MTKKIECCNCENKNCSINKSWQPISTGIFVKNLNEETVKSPLNLVKCHGNNGCGLVQFYIVVINIKCMVKITDIDLV